MSKTNKGFSVIELSIVLVVVTIIISVFFYGSSVLDNSKINAIISEFQTMKSSHDAFREKYSYRPGDLPEATANSLFTGNATVTGTGSCLLLVGGNGQWDNMIELDLAFNQLSQSAIIRQQIDFDPCPTGTIDRIPGVHRVESAVFNGAGFTFINSRSFTFDSTDYDYAFIIAYGGFDANATTTDTMLQRGVIPVEFHRTIDAKIDMPNTPFSGKYIVGATGFFSSEADSNYGCVTSATQYEEDSNPARCVGYLVEYSSENIE